MHIFMPSSPYPSWHVVVLLCRAVKRARARQCRPLRAFPLPARTHATGLSVADWVIFEESIRHRCSSRAWEPSREARDTASAIQSRYTEADILNYSDFSSLPWNSAVIWQPRSFPSFSSSCWLVCRARATASGTGRPAPDPSPSSPDTLMNVRHGELVGFAATRQMQIMLPFLFEWSKNVFRFFLFFDSFWSLAMTHCWPGPSSCPARPAGAGSAVVRGAARSAVRTGRPTAAGASWRGPAAACTGTSGWSAAGPASRSAPVSTWACSPAGVSLGPATTVIYDRLIFL